MLSMQLNDFPKAHEGKKRVNYFFILNKHIRVYNINCGNEHKSKTRIQHNVCLGKAYLHIIII